MGFIADSVEATHGGHHFGIRATSLTFEGFGLGVACTLYVDGRRCDRRLVYPWQRTTLVGLAGDEVVLVAIRQTLLTTAYRLFVGDVEVPLHVEPGCSSLSIILPPPMLPAVTRAQLEP